MNISELKPLFPEEYTDGGPLVIAGPCSAESETQVLDAAHALMNEGIRIFRAGVWKPRTKPGGFEGMGTPALEWLAEAKRQTGMLISTEVAYHRQSAVFPQLQLPLPVDAEKAAKHLPDKIQHVTVSLDVIFRVDGEQLRAVWHPLDLLLCMRQLHGTGFAA